MKRFQNYQGGFALSLCYDKLEETLNELIRACFPKPTQRVEAALRGLPYEFLAEFRRAPAQVEPIGEKLRSLQPNG